MYKYSISQRILRHIFIKHKDLAKALDVKNTEELYDKLKNLIEHADETYTDIFNATYYVKKINELYVNIIIYGNVVKTAYLLSHKTYNKMKRKKWIQKPP